MELFFLGTVMTPVTIAKHFVGVFDTLLEAAVEAVLQAACLL